MLFMLCYVIPPTVSAEQGAAAHADAPPDVVERILDGFRGAATYADASPDWLGRPAATHAPQHIVGAHDPEDAARRLHPGAPRAHADVVPKGFRRGQGC